MVVVNEFVDFVGGYAGLDELSDVVEGFGDDALPSSRISRFLRGL